jgi:hypothetical protein
MVLAASSAQVITNLPDDEGDMVNRRGAEIGLGTVLASIPAWPASHAAIVSSSRRAFLLTATGVDNVKVSHAGKTYSPRVRQAPDIWPRIVAFATANSSASCLSPLAV